MSERGTRQRHRGKWFLFPQVIKSKFPVHSLANHDITENVSGIGATAANNSFGLQIQNSKWSFEHWTNDHALAVGGRVNTSARNWDVLRNDLPRRESHLRCFFQVLFLRSHHFVGSDKSETVAAYPAQLVRDGDLMS